MLSLVDFLKEAASNPKTPESVLIDLSTHSDTRVRYALACNHSIPEKAQLNLAKDDSYPIRSVLAWHTSYDSVFTVLEKDDEVRDCLLDNDNTPAWVLDRFATGDARGLFKVVIHKNVTGDIIKKIYKLAYEQNAVTELVAIARSKFCTKKMRYELLRRPESGVRSSLCKNPYLSKKELSLLANDKEATVRQEVAERRRLSLSQIRRLSKDKDSRVRVAIVFNPVTPVDVLEQLAMDDDESVRNFAFFKLGKNKDALCRLSYNSKISVRECAYKCLKRLAS